MAYQLAVFDIAGTTVADQDAVARAFGSAFEKHGMKVSHAEIKPLMGYKKTLAIESVLRNNLKDYDEVAVESIHSDFVLEMVDYYTNNSGVQPLPGAEDVFIICRKMGIKVALNTGFPRIIADTIVERLGWKSNGMVDDYIASDEVKRGRPFPDMIKTLMLRSGITDPLGVIKTGDTEVDVNEGRAAGCGLVVAVTTGAFTRHQLEPYHPDHIIDSLHSFPALIQP